MYSAVLLHSLFVLLSHQTDSKAAALVGSGITLYRNRSDREVRCRLTGLGVCISVHNVDTSILEIEYICTFQINQVGSSPIHKIS